MDEAAFNDSYAVSEVLETDLNPRAPKSGAEKMEVVNKLPHAHTTCSQHSPQVFETENVPPPRTALRVEIPVEEIIIRLRSELEPSLQAAAKRAAAQEHERTREWLESRGLPKAARVAQREAYNVLRQHGLRGAAKPARSGTTARQSDPAPTPAHRLSEEEIKELAETCVAMLEVHSQPVDVTLSELSAEAGGILLTEDAPRVRELAEALAYSGGRKE